MTKDKKINPYWQAIYEHNACKHNQAQKGQKFSITEPGFSRQQLYISSIFSEE